MKSSLLLGLLFLFDGNPIGYEAKTLRESDLVVPSPNPLSHPNNPHIFYLKKLTKSRDNDCESLVFEPMWLREGDSVEITFTYYANGITEGITRCYLTSSRSFLMQSPSIYLDKTGKWEYVRWKLKIDSEDDYDIRFNYMPNFNAPPETMITPDWQAIIRIQDIRVLVKDRMGNVKFPNHGF